MRFGRRNFILATTGVKAANYFYRILVLQRFDQTRAAPWYDDLTLIAAQGAAPNQREIEAGQYTTLGSV